MARCIFLTGAPEADALTWDRTAFLSAFESPIKRFLGAELPASTSLEPSTYTLPKWRAVVMDSKDRADTDPTDDAERPPQTQFLSFEDAATPGRDRLHFLEQSLARLDDMASSQIAPVADDTTFISAGTFTTSFDSTSYPTSYASFSTASPTQADPAPMAAHQQQQQQQPVHFPGAITDIKRIPSAAHLVHIAPQTITVNLLAAIISIAPPRTVRLRKRPNAEMDILELLVGDETRAGFSVSFWLAPAASQQQQRNLKDADDMRHTLRQLRAGDVVLLQNIALSAFNACVYGQSLSKRFARNSTRVAVLEAPTQAQVQGKWERVRQWGDAFVGREGRARGGSLAGGGSSGETKRSGVRVRREELPPDTQSPTKGS
ncbi:hypothetical protein LTR36_002495 [Oleoguttula mirabilis]|uniref:Uncharacterized protein n=1 Tax=Oleoguttula mirabilis TaxID=1507867 RepID=A0AAV9JKZ8_9PEZI|nr:hypothetical protein LTR36_002495 [Oleoguttula mirabilis]